MSTFDKPDPQPTPKKVPDATKAPEAVVQASVTGSDIVTSEPSNLVGHIPTIAVGKKTDKASDRIRARLQAEGKRFFANDTIYQHVQEGELEEIKREVQTCVENLLNALVIDQSNDHNTKETGKRVAKMYVDEVMMGRFTPPPTITSFPNDRKLDQLYAVGPIRVRSMCSHHFVPIMGDIWVGVLPGKTLIGLSKFNRISHWIMSRPTIQEEAVVQLADMLEKSFEPIGLAVTFRAQHLCACWRGVKDESTMTNTVLRGVLASNPSAKQEYFETIRAQGFK